MSISCAGVVQKYDFIGVYWRFSFGEKVSMFLFLVMISGNNNKDRPKMTNIRINESQDRFDLPQVSAPTPVANWKLFD